MESEGKSGSGSMSFECSYIEDQMTAPRVLDNPSTAKRVERSRDSFPPNSHHLGNLLLSQVGGNFNPFPCRAAELRREIKQNLGQPLARIVYAAFATYLSMFFICSAQPPSFLRKVSRRKSPGILSKPDSVSTSNVPAAVFSNLNSTSVVGSFEWSPCAYSALSREVG